MMTNPNVPPGYEQPSGSKKNLGFTLVELLVVISIIGLLLSLLMPAISNARSRGDQVSCLNNSRQFGVAWLMYCSDFGDSLPPNVDGFLGGFTNWVAGNMANPTDAKDAALLIDPGRSLLASYIRNPRIFKCPADDSVYVRSVAMNCRLNPTRLLGEPRWVGGQGSAFRTFFRLSDIAKPANIFVIIDESESTINDAYFAVDMSNTGNFYGVGTQQPFYLIDFPAHHHARSATVCFADGHAVAHRWNHHETFSQRGPVRHVPGSQDARWLQEHCTFLSE